MHVNIMLDILETDSDAAKSSGTVKDELVATGVEVEEGKVLSEVEDEKVATGMEADVEIEDEIVATGMEADVEIEDEIVATGMEADVEIEDSEVLWHDLLWLPRAWEVDIFLPQDWHSY
jgi:hypothetical protein